jgi:cystathionine beta-lyase
MHSTDPVSGDVAAIADATTVERLREVGGLKWSAFGPDILGAFVAEMDFGTAPAVAHALHAMVDDALLGYLPPRLPAELSAACADWHRDRYGWAVEPGQVRIVPDVLRALELMIAHWSPPGSPVIVPTPAYMPFLDLPLRLGREILQLPMVLRDGRWTFDLEGLASAFAAGGHVLVLCNPYNPLGRVFTREELAAVCDVVQAHGGRVFPDEIHAPLVYAGHRHVPYASISAAAAGHTLTATSASKAWNLAGLKCAQVVLSAPDDAARWERLGPWAVDGAAVPGVIANIAAYRFGGQWLDDVRTYLDGTRRI